MDPEEILQSHQRAEEVLYTVLKEEKIAGAGLDAMVFEPPVESPLLKLDNFVATSHFGATTYDAGHKMGMMAVQNLIDVIETGSSPYSLR